MDLITVPGGEVTLADRRSERRWTVPVDGFRLAATPLTRADAGSLGAGSLGSGSLGAASAGVALSSGEGRLPVESVSWWDALRLCNALSERDGLTPAYRFSTGTGTAARPAAALPGHGRFSPGGRPDTGGRLQPDGSVLASDGEPGVTWDRAAAGYRLPTEAEWEHACRAGTTGARYGPLDDIAWYRGNSGERLPEAGRKAPNAWGLHDMLGTVWEWCWDVYDAEVYGSYRVLRGGGWFDEEWSCRASVRRRSHPTLTLDDVGLRPARNVAPQGSSKGGA